MSQTPEIELTVDQANALVGDDITYWLANPFTTPDMLAEKVCWWIGRALVARPTADGAENWNPNTATPACDWCGECEWCQNLHVTRPARNGTPS